MIQQRGLPDEMERILVDGLMILMCCDGVIKGWIGGIFDDIKRFNNCGCDGVIPKYNDMRNPQIR